jgi:hypothetical protein
MTKSKVSPTSIVVYKQNPNNQNKNKKNNNSKNNKYEKIMRKNGFSRQLLAQGAYEYALTQPFSEYAMGAKVPDMYSAHTITSIVKKTLTMTTTAGGIADMIIMPNIAAICLSAAGTTSGASTVTYGDNTTQATSLISGPTISQLMDTYRIVGMGVRIAGVAAATATSGKVVIACVPQSSYLKVKNFTLSGVTSATNASATETATYNSWGVPISAGVFDTPTLVQFPGAEVRSLNDISLNPLEIVPNLADPEAFVFRHSADDIAGYNSVDVTAGGALVGGNPSYLCLNGFEAVVLGISGGPASTAVLDVEIVYHLEGTPNVTASTISANMSPSSARSPVNWNTFQKAITLASNSPTIKKIAGDFLLNTASNYLGVGALNTARRFITSGEL